jgi:tRNA A-37 threonylcarbamoyl transferase component Bud32/tetratricopeptide (TPR) repeat protein
VNPSGDSGPSGASARVEADGALSSANARPPADPRISAAALEASLERTPPVPIQSLSAEDPRGGADDRTSGESEPRTTADGVPIQVGRFTVLQRLGSGGMGVVYAAYDPELDRRVAVKVLHAKGKASTNATARARLLREAKALAKLSHPNVVAIFEVGTVDEQVFIAMEFVKGVTLTRWLREPEEQGDGTVTETRDWKDVLAVFIQAGRGLAAAHKAGIVHRDFKPDNVLIGHDGRVRVVDFGLARSDNGRPNRPDTFAEAIKSLSSNSSSVFDLQLTRTGGLAGTPAYMAPEQYLNLQVDARTDQFSFCVALYEGLYGKRPFVGDTVARVRKSVIGGEIAEEPSGSGVPAWLRRILLRGLAVAPGSRYPSMDALLADLSDDPVRPRAWLGVIGIGGAIAIAIAITLTLAKPSRDRLPDATACYAELAAVDDTYDDARRQALRARFLAADEAPAAAVWERVDGHLSDLSRAWRRSKQDLCVLSRYQGARTTDFIRQQSACLDRQLSATRALLDRLSEPTPALLKAATPAVLTLAGLPPCADPSSLRPRVDESVDPALQEVGQQLREQLDEVRALFWLNQETEALAGAQRIAAAAAEHEHLPVRAEALALQGALEDAMGLHDAAEQSLKEALWHAEASHHDEIAVDALSALVRVLGVQLYRHEEASLLAPRLTAAVRRLGDRRREVVALCDLGRAEAAAGNHEAALVRLQSARERAGGLHDPAAGPRLARVLLDLAEALRAARRAEEAILYAQQAQGLLEQAYGADHPKVAASALSLCETSLAQGELTRALRPCRRALDLHEAAASRPDLRGRARFALARYHDQAGDPARARQLAQRAESELTEAGSAGARDLARVRSWLNERGG